MAKKKTDTTKKELTKLELLEVVRSLEDNTVTYTVRFNVGATEQTVDVTFENLYKVLSKAGYPTDDFDVTKIKQELYQQIPPDYFLPTTYKTLGWEYIDEKPVFKGHKLIPRDLKGYYSGIYDIKPVGKPEELSSALNDVIMDHVPLEFITICGLASSLLGYLKRVGEKVPTILVDIHGESSAGKTSCAELATGMGCNPDPPDGLETLSQDFNTTYNGLIATLGGNYGYSLALDEVGGSEGKINLDSAVYSLANSRGKGRCDKDGNPVIRKNWCTVILITGEVSVLDLVEQLDGIVLRVLSICEEKWAEDADHIQKINDLVKNFHGLPIDLFSEKLSKLGVDDVVSDFRQQTKEMEKRITLTDANKANRMAKIVAIYRIAAYIASVALNVSYDIRELTEYLLNIINSKQEILDRKDEYDEFISFVESNRKNFGNSKPKNVGSITLHNYWGTTIQDEVEHGNVEKYGYIRYTYDTDKNYIPQYIVVLKKVLDEWYEKRHKNKAGLRKMLGAWETKDRLIRAEGDRLASDMKINDSGNKAPCYIIAAKPDMKPIPKEAYIRKPPKSPIPPIGQKTIEDMLSDDE